MKKLITLISICFAIQVYSQIPEGYYSSAEGLSGTELKTALYNIIKGHTQFPYTSSGTDVWDILKETDKDPNNPENVIQIYTGWSVNAAQEYNNGNGWEREHVWAKVHGGFDTNPPAGTDTHHLRPIDPSVNSARNSRYLANCTQPYLDGGLYTGCFTGGSSSWVWKPRDEDKGDVARMIFYMATRYEGFNGEPDLEVIDYIPSNNNSPEPIMALLNDLLQWNSEDPVDAWEQNRNNIIYYNFQNNRNPYIDHPEFVTQVWGEPIYYFTITVIQHSNGYISPATISIPENSSQIFTITPNSGYKIETATYNETDITGELIDNGNYSTYEVSDISVNGTLTATYSLSLNDKLIKNKFEVFPNPANNFITVNCSSNENSEIQIFNILGIKVFDTTTTDFPEEINISDFSSGIYYLKIIQNNKFIDTKFVKK